MEMSDEGIEQRKHWFEWYMNQLEGHSVTAEPTPGQKYRCPCCRVQTLEERGAFEICPVCFWEDDGQDDADAEVVRGGPNGRLSLSAARQNYIRLGACEPRFAAHVRPPLPEEVRTEEAS
jgi:hypothetical protein